MYPLSMLDLSCMLTKGHMGPSLLPTMALASSLELPVGRAKIKSSGKLARLFPGAGSEFVSGRGQGTELINC